MFVVSLDTSKFDATLESMLKQLNAFPHKMADELTAWQVEDMHRKFPNTDLKENTATTKIWPRSRMPETDKTKIRAAMRRPVIRKGSAKPSSGNRAILRPELYEKLVKRMDELMSKELSWQ
jgi:hypothetical protein